MSALVLFAFSPDGNGLDNQPPGSNLIRMKVLAELAKDALESPPIQRLTLARRSGRSRSVDQVFADLDRRFPT